MNPSYHAIFNEYSMIIDRDEYKARLLCFFAKFIHRIWEHQKEFSFYPFIDSVSSVAKREYHLFKNGNLSSKWGRRRKAYGHPVKNVPSDDFEATLSATAFMLEPQDTVNACLNETLGLMGPDDTPDEFIQTIKNIFEEEFECETPITGTKNDLYLKH